MSTLVTPKATLKIQKYGTIAVEGNVDMWEFDATVNDPSLVGQVSWAADEEGTVGSLSATIRGVDKTFANQVQPGGLVVLEGGYVAGSNIVPRMMFWGFLDTFLPTRTGAELTYQVNATSRNYPMDFVRYPGSFVDTSARSVLSSLLAACGLALDDNELARDVESVEVSMVSHASVWKHIMHVVAELRAKLNRPIELYPTMGGLLRYHLVDTSVGIEQSILLIDLDTDAFYNASVQANRAVPSSLQFYNPKTGQILSASGSEVEEDEKTMLEYSLSTPLDPRVELGMLVGVGGLPVPHLPSPASFSISRVEHSFGSTDWTTNYGGPYLGPDYDSAIDTSNRGAA